MYRGAGHKSQRSTAAYEAARAAALRFAGRPVDGDDVAEVASGKPAPVGYHQDPGTGDYYDVERVVDVAVDDLLDGAGHGVGRGGVG